jgi:hypothetical protein
MFPMYRDLDLDHNLADVSGALGLNEVPEKRFPGQRSYVAKLLFRIGLLVRVEFPSVQRT